MDDQNRPQPNDYTPRNHHEKSKAWLYSRSQAVITFVGFMFMGMIFFIAKSTVFNFHLSFNIWIIWSQIIFFGNGGLIIFLIFHFIFWILSLSYAGSQIKYGRREDNELSKAAGFFIYFKFLSAIPIIGWFTLFTSFFGMVMSIIVWSHGPHQ